MTRLLEQVVRVEREDQLKIEKNEDSSVVVASSSLASKIIAHLALPH
jgi:hypothetical protein